MKDLACLQDADCLASDAKKLKIVRFQLTNWKRLIHQVSTSTALALLPLTLLATAGIAQVLQPGDSGPEVQSLQQSLQTAGFFNQRATGFYGEATEEAVRQFQSARGLEVDGIAGSATLQALGKSNCPDNSGYVRPVSYSGYPQLGSSGSNVTLIQERLNALGYPVAVDGVFGPETDSAVRQFQAVNGLAVDGVVGPATRQALITGGVYRPVSTPANPTAQLLRLGDRGPEVAQLQTRLSALGYYTGPINGVFDQQTEFAVRQFQSANGLVPDGIVGITTWAKLRQDIVMPPSTLPSQPQPGIPPLVQSRPYVVVIPSPDGTALYQVRRYAPWAYWASDRRGNYINAGTYPDLRAAQQQSQYLRNAGFDSRVVYF